MSGLICYNCVRGADRGQVGGLSFSRDWVCCAGGLRQDKSLFPFGFCQFRFLSLYVFVSWTVLFFLRCVFFNCCLIFCRISWARLSAPWEKWLVLWAVVWKKHWGKFVNSVDNLNKCFQPLLWRDAWSDNGERRCVGVDHHVTWG